MSCEARNESDVLAFLQRERAEEAARTKLASIPLLGCSPELAMLILEELAKLDAKAEARARAEAWNSERADDGYLDAWAEAFRDNAAAARTC